MIRIVLIIACSLAALGSLVLGVISRSERYRWEVLDTRRRWIFIDVGGWRISAYELMYGENPPTLRQSLRPGARFQNAWLRGKRGSWGFFYEHKAGPVSGYRFVALPMAAPVVFFVLYPVSSGTFQWARRYRRRKRGRCTRCAYDLTGNVSNTCPECGAAIRPKRGHGSAETGKDIHVPPHPETEPQRGSPGNGGSSG